MITNKEWSMDFFLISNLNTLIQQYIEARFIDNYDAMFKAIDCLEMLSSPKVDNDDVEKNLKEIETLLESTEQRDETGNVICEYPARKKKLKHLLNETFRLILVKLEKKHIYTQEIQDPNKAMGNMDA